MKILKQVHQGDVLFLKVDTLPAGEQQQQLPSSDKGIVIHHGEALGHYHRIPNPTAGLVAVRISDGNSVQTMALKVTQPTEVVHEEHNPVMLDVGHWIARTQRESFQGMTREIAD